MEVEGEDEPAVRGKERTTLEQRLGARLALVQSVMAREQVLWNSGYLAMPQVRAWVNFLIHEPPPPPPEWPPPPASLPPSRGLLSRPLPSRAAAASLTKS